MIIFFYFFLIHQIESPSTPTISLDANFSKILRKKREEQLEASRLRSFECNASKLSDNTGIQNETDIKSKSIDTVTAMKCKPLIDLENSMLFPITDKSSHDLSTGEDSFLAMERLCNMEDKKEQMINANDTVLFEVEPPSELWNQTVNPNSMNLLPDENETFELSPVKYIGLVRPSTIIEETSSQLNSISKNNNSSASSSTKSINGSSKLLSIDEGSEESNKTTENHIKTLNSIDVQPLKSHRRSRRETFAFKRRNYTFFGDENLQAIDESESYVSRDNDSEIETPKQKPLSEIQTPKEDLIEFGDADESNDDPQQFNDTMEAVDFFIKKGKKIIEQTPVADRNVFQRSVIMETPLFSCKRKRILSEMANTELLPLPKRGPLIDFSTPDNSSRRQ